MQLMKQVFQCNIESFDEGGDLYILKETFLASLLMHYDELERDCGVLNIVSSMLLRKADDAKITCADSPDLTCDRVLRRWSAAIKAEFKHETSINVLKMSDPPGQHNSSMLATLAESVNSLKMTVEKLDVKIDDLVQKNIDNEVTISLLRNQNKALRDEVTTLNIAAASRSQLLMTTPENNRNKRPRMQDDVNPLVIDETAASSPSPAPSPAAAPVTAPAPVAPSTTNNTSTAAAEATANNTSTAAAAATATNIPNAVATAPTALAPFTTRHTTLRFNHAANQVAIGASNSMSGKGFGDALTFMASGRHNLLRGLTSKLSDKTIPSGEYGEKSHLRNCLELADFVAEYDDDVKEHIETLRSAVEATDPVVIDDAAGSIVDACAMELDILVPPQQGRKCGTTISGMHRRIQKYKQEIIQKKNLTCRPGEVKLVRLEEEE